MKKRHLVVILLAGLVVFSATACGQAGAEEPEPPEQSTDQTDLPVTVSGNGNIEISNEIKLTFAVAGKIDKISVEEGQEVSQGEILASLEDDTLKLALAKAQVDRTQAQLALTQAEMAVIQGQADITQAELAVETAQYNLDQATNDYQWPELEIAQANVDRSRHSVENAQARLAEATTPEDIAAWTRNVALAQTYLLAEQDKLNAMLSGADTEEVALKQLQVETANQTLELAQMALEPAGQNLELARQSLELTRQSLELAQKQLEKATIISPFDGVIAGINADEGDTVSTTTSILHLVDLNSLELNIEVDEIDIPRVEPGQRVTIELDALPGILIDGTVRSLSLLSTQGIGLVMYDVKISLDVPEGIRLRAGMSASADIIVSQ